MRRPTSRPVLIQVAALAALAVIMSQAVAFGVVVVAPEPRPAGFGVEAAASALKGEPAETSDGRVLKRRITNGPIKRNERDTNDPVALAITASLAQRLGVAPDRVVVSVAHGPRRHRRDNAERVPPNLIFVRPEGSAERVIPENGTARVVVSPAPVEQENIFKNGQEATRFTLRRSEGGGVRHEGLNREGGRRGGREGREDRELALGARVEQITILADRLTFAPFSASVRQDDGRWATVEPPRGLLSPWQRRVLLALAISMLLLAPLVWWMARRLTRPIRVFAEAAERLGADPEAEPLKPSGPSEVRTAIHAFNDMQASLRDHMRRRTQTVAAIAHDLRTPLTRLRFRAEQAPEAVRDRMAADIEEMDALIAQAMAYVRGESPPERRERFDLDALAADCAGGFAETGADVVFDGGGRLAVDADPAALRRALANLIGNAVKYGGGARVKAFAADDRAVVTVEDDGPGLAVEELEAVFEPFHRAERSRNRETGGAGLGLTVARQAARAHGGDVVLIPREPRGLTARLELPIASIPTETP